MSRPGKSRAAIELRIFTLGLDGCGQFNYQEDFSINKQPTTNNLVIGAGLAGCCLGWRLQQKGHAFRVIGSSKRPSAANVAAGIINPVTGRWMTKSWRFDDFAPEAADFYRSIEKALSIQFYHPLPAIRYCLNDEDAKRAKRRCRNPRYADVLAGYDGPDQAERVFHDAHGSIQITGAAYVDLPFFLNALRRHFQAGGYFTDAVFEHADLERHDSHWCYEGDYFDRVIFCEGASLKQNPWFGELPLTPIKGETLLCQCDSLHLDERLYHHDKWLLPYPDQSFRIGATYDEDDLSDEPTSQGRDELLAALEAMTREPHRPKILKQLVGIRPSTRDARPLVGAHPDRNGLYLFNGLGSKGASLAPTLSRELLAFIFEAAPLDPETDLRRFYS